MAQVIRVLLLNPFTQVTLVVGLERPLEWKVVLKEFFQAINDCDDEPEQTRYDSCKIFLHPLGSTKAKGVAIRKANLDRAIRDGDLLSVEGLVDVHTNSNSMASDTVAAIPPVCSTDLLDVMESIDIDIDIDIDTLTGDLLSPPSAISTSQDTDPRYTSFPQMNNARAQPSSYSSTTSATCNASSTSRKNKRGRSLSSKFWLVNKLANSGKITKEQKDMLKLFLIACDDYTINQAFETYEETGDLASLLDVPTKSMRRQLGDMTLSSQPEVSLTQSMKDELQLLSSVGHDPTSFGGSSSHPYAPITSLDQDSHEINPLDEFSSSLLDLPLPLGYKDVSLASGIAQDLQGIQEWLRD